MTLLDLRRYAIRAGVSVRFETPTVGECLIDQHGLLKIPSLRSAPDFNMEALLGSVDEFVLDPAAPNSKRRKVSRAELQSLLGEAPKADSGHDD